MTAKARRATVDVVVVVNHDQLRTGEAGEVELDDRVRRLLDLGYLRLADVGDPVTGRRLGDNTTAPGSLLGVATEPAEVTPNGPITDQSRTGNGKD